MAKRYDQLVAIAKSAQPKTIVEIGVHRAMRAVRMCEVVRGPVHYIGYDVFETMGDEFQEAALNGKGQPTEAAARKRLDALKALKPDFTYELVVGDTRETLRDKSIQCDLAFIDGDHRVDAIENDYAAVCTAPVVVFDDYYTGKCPDLTLYGANAIVNEIRLNGGNVEVLPVADICKHGGLSHLAVVRQ